MTSPDLLASDAERADAVEQLSLHCARGRLTLEEFESRVAGAYAARTVSQLDGLLADLPREREGERGRQSDTSGAAAAHTRPAVGLPGLRPFTTRTELDADRDRVEAAALHSLAPALNRYGYELRQRSPATLVFERRGRPGWVPFVAVFTFPIGLVALAVHETQRIVISMDQLDGDRTALTVYGTAPRAVRKAFAELGPPRLQQL
jgi:Domain of unknown function (DUF1707)